MATSVRLSGPFFAPKHVDAVCAALLASIKIQEASVRAAVEAATPVDSGELKASIKPKVTARGREIPLSVLATATNKQGFPYGYVVDWNMGFISNTLAAHRERLMTGIRDATGAFVARLNNGAL